MTAATVKGIYPPRTSRNVTVFNVGAAELRLYATADEAAADVHYIALQIGYGESFPLLAPLSYEVPDVAFYAKTALAGTLVCVWY